MKKTPLIIDTDLTRDDVVALAMAANSHIYDIKAITCYGEWFVETVQLRDSLGLDCPVCWGAMKPLFRQHNSEDIYGNMEASFDGNTRIGTKDEEYPWDKIYAEAVNADGTLEIITLGPVTNIAQTILRYPQVKNLISRIFCFAGSGYVGNVLPYSEYNAFTDPDALKILMDSGIAVTLCGLDGIENCGMEREEIKDIHCCNETVENVLSAYRRSTQPQITIPSAAAMYCALSTDGVQTADYYVAVETKSPLCMGQTVVDRLGKYKKAANATVVTRCDKAVFLRTLASIAE